MLKMIVKNLWSHRKDNGWIFIELIIVSIILWVLLDVSAVYLYNDTMSLGYDNNQLCKIDLVSYTPADVKYNSDYDSLDLRKEHVDRIMRKLKAQKGVENVTYQFTSWNYINSESNMTYHYISGNQSIDSLVKQVDVVRFIPGNNFFETYGMESVAGSPSAEELSKMDYGYSDIIVTEDYARRFFGDENAVGKKLYFINSNNDTIWSPIKGVLKDVRHQQFRPVNSLAFRPQYDSKEPEVTMTVRLLPNVDVEEFVKMLESSEDDFSSGNYYVFDVCTYNDLIRKVGDEYEIFNRLVFVLMIFFMINVGLGIMGTFWLQTRNRTRDAGVMRSFGATRWNIRKMLLGEGVVLSTIAVAIGCFIYYHVALEFPFLSKAFAIRYDEGFNIIDYWVTNFGEHFMIISLLCYVVVVLTVSIGIYIPARKISNVNPIDALREE